MCHYYSTFRFILQPFGVPSLISLLTSAVTGRSLSDETFNDLSEILSGDIQSENPIVDLNNRHKRSDTKMSSEALNIFSETVKYLSNSNDSSINQLFRYDELENPTIFLLKYSDLMPVMVTVCMFPLALWPLSRPC